MKRRDLIRHLQKYGCELAREGSRHSIYKNIVSGGMSAVPRHREVNELLVKKICRDLDVKLP